MTYNEQADLKDFDLIASSPTMGWEIQHQSDQGPRILWTTTCLPDGTPHPYTYITSDVCVATPSDAADFYSIGRTGVNLSAQLLYDTELATVTVWIWQHHADSTLEGFPTRQLVGHLQPDGEVAILCASFPHQVSHISRTHPNVNLARRKVQRLFGAWQYQDLTLQLRDGGYVILWGDPKDGRATGL